MSTKSIFFGIVAIVVLFLIQSMVYILPEYQKAVVLRFGTLQPDYPDTGINFKYPFADEVVKFDGRILTLDAPPKILLTKQQKRLEVDSYAKWRVKDVGLYYVKTGGSERLAANALSDRIDREISNQLGQRTLEEAVSGERDQLMTDLTKAIDDAVGQELGIEVLDIRVKQIELPPEVRDSVYSRMQTERNKTAQEYRSGGAKLAEERRAAADRQKVVIEATAYKESELIRGAGDARATGIYAAAYSQDAEFYSFVRSLNAYQTTFSNKSDMMLVDPKSDFFRYLKNPNGSFQE
ncbi:MAG: membrane protease subunit HflC [Cellvibrionaceae bacterium]|jgi:membrane protease subunit HflC